MGPRHPDTLISVSNLAFIWKDMGRHGDAVACGHGRRAACAARPFGLGQVHVVRARRGGPVVGAQDCEAVGVGCGEGEAVEEREAEEELAESADRSRE